MSEWFDQYMQRLSAVSAAGGRQGEPATNITARILNSGLPAPTVTAPKPKNRSPFRLGFGNNFDITNNLLVKPGMAVLDILSRPNYAVANPFTQAEKQGKATSIDIFDGRERTSIGEDLTNMWRGFSGQDRNTFGDALRESGMDAGWKRAAAGFGLDVVSDPLNLIPAAWIAKAGRGASKLVPKPTQPAVSGVTRQETSLVPGAPATTTEVPTPLGPGPSAGAAPGAPAALPAGATPAPSPEIPKFDENSRILQELLAREDLSDAAKAAAAKGEEFVPPVPKNQGALFNLQAFKNQSLIETVNKGISNVPTVRVAPKYFTERQVGTEPIYKDIVQEVDEVVDELPVGDGLPVISKALVERQIRNTPDYNVLLPKEYQGVESTIRTSPKGVKTVSKIDLQKWVNKGGTAAEKAKRQKAAERAINESVERAAIRVNTSGFSKIHSVKAVGTDGVTRPVGFEDIVDDVLSGENFSNDVRIIDESTGEPGVGYGDLVKDLQSRIPATKPVTPGKKKITVKEKIGDKPIYSKGRPDQLARMLWTIQMENAGFTKTEINSLIRNANLGEDKYESLLQRIVGTPFSKSYTLDDFISGVRDGSISDVSPEITKMYRTLGITAKTTKGRINQFEKKVADLRKRAEKTPVVDSPAERGLLFDLTAGEAKAKKAKVAKKTQGEVDRALNDPDGPWTKAQIEAAAVPSAENIVDEANAIHGDSVVSQVLNAPKITLDPKAVPAVEKTLREISISQFGNKAKGDIWGHRTNRQAHRTSTKPGEGYARWPALTSHAQYTVSKVLQANLIDSGAYAGLEATGRAEIFLDSLKAVEETFKSRAIAPTLTDGMRGIPLSAHDILSTLGPEWTAKNYLNINAGIPPTHLHRLVEELIDATIKGGVNEKELYNSVHSWVEKGLPSKSGKPRESGSWKAAKNSGNTGKYVLNTFYKPLVENVPEFLRKTEENRAFMNLKNGEMTKQLTDEVMDDFIKAANNGEIAKSIRHMAELRKSITESVKGAGADKVQGIGKLVEDEVTAELGERGASLSSAAKGAEQLGNAKTVGEKKVIVGKIVDDADKQVGALVEQTDDVWDVSQKMLWRMDANAARRFAPHLGNKNLRPVMIGQRNFAIQNASRFTRMLSDLTKKYETADINAAFNFVKAGGDTENATGAVSEVSRLVNLFLDPKNPKYDLLHRNGMLVGELNRQFDHFGVPGNLRFKKSLDEWTKWDIEDPLDFLSKAHASAQQVMAYQTLGWKFSKDFGSATKSPGMVKIVNDSTTRDSILFNYIDPEKYYSREIAQEMSVLDEFLVTTSKPSSRNKLLRQYDTALYAFKAGYTVYRLGHHVRNGLGDAWLNFMDGVTNPKYYNDALHVLGTGKGKYADFDLNAALQAGSEVPGQNASFLGKGLDSNKIVAKVKINGKNIKFNAANIYQKMYEKGALPDHMTIEDIRFDEMVGGEKATSEVGRSVGEKIVDRVKRPAGGRIREQAVRVSEVRDHYFRVSHFLHAMENGKLPKGWKGTDDEAIEYLTERAAQRVRKYHPDGSDLAPFERDVMRRGVTFYSWARKALPLVIELMLLHPGRFMVYPKAMYNTAQGMGIDLEGMHDPFPEDQLFPSFMRESVQGPIMGSSGNYWGMRAGNPGMDIIDDFLYNAPNLRDTLAQSTTPFVRAPAEFMSGAKWGTGVPIQDKSDYVGQQIPNMGYLDKVSNSLTGRTVSSGFSDDLYVAKSNEGYTPDMPGPMGKAGVVNWLLGLGFTDMSKPSYIKTAEREQGEGFGR